MALFIGEDSKKLNKRQIIIPDAVADKLHQNMNMYSKDKTSDGYKRLKALTDDSYNKRSNRKDAQHNDKMTVSFGDAKRIVHDMSHMTQSPKNKEFNMIGGYDTLYTLKNGLKQARSSVKQVNPVPEVPKLEKNPLKPDDPKDDIKMGSLNVHINESLDDFYEDYYYEYGISTVLNDFLENPTAKQDWGVLIDPSQYKKALTEFTRFGRFTSFPTQKVYQWMGIIMRNTAKLIANTVLIGHSDSPIDLYDFQDFLETYLGENFVGIRDNCILQRVNEEFVDEQCERDYVDISEAKNLSQKIAIYNEKMMLRDNRFSITNNGDIQFSEDYIDFFDRIGFYDTMILPDGSDAFSDYGLDPLLEIISKYNNNLQPEEVIVLVNKCLDIYHRRGDLASAFIVGGSKSLSWISENVEKINGKKTIYLTEKQLKLIKEYHNQLKIPFSNPSQAYDLKNNYEHLIDYFELIGKYGRLGPSQYKEKTYTNFLSGHIDELLGAFRDWIETYEINGLSLFIEFIEKYGNNDNLFNGDYLKSVRDLYEEIGELTVDDLIDLKMMSASEIDEKESYIDCFGLTSENSPYLTPEGKNTFKNEIIKPAVDEFVNDHFDYLWDIDERGLIKIEREITTPNMRTAYADTESGVTHDENNYYNILSSYGGIGVCWAFAQGEGEAYCGESYKTGTFNALLIGYVDPKDVDWVATLELNLNNPEEYELRLKPSALVEIDEVRFDDTTNPKVYPNGYRTYGTNKLPLKSPIIVRVTDGNAYKNIRRD